MRKISIITILLMVSAFAFASDFRVYLPDVKGGVFGNAQVLNGFGCSGENISPAVKWENPPKGTKSFALSMYDPDAPTGSGWWHWIVTDIPADATGIEKGGKLPKGAVDMKTDFGQAGYGGPCPPMGENHRYIITVSALKVDKLGVAPESSGAMTGFMTNMNTIEKASVIVRYGRK